MTILCVCVCVFIHAKFIQVFRLGNILVPGSRAIAGMKAQEAAARSEKSEKSNPADSCEAMHSTLHSTLHSYGQQERWNCL